MSEEEIETEAEIRFLSKPDRLPIFDAQQYLVTKTYGRTEIEDSNAARLIAQEYYAFDEQERGLGLLYTDANTKNKLLHTTEEAWWSGARNYVLLHRAYFSGRRGRGWWKTIKEWKKPEVFANNLQLALAFARKLYLDAFVVFFLHRDTNEQFESVSRDDRGLYLLDSGRVQPVAQLVPVKSGGRDLQYVALNNTPLDTDQALREEMERYTLVMVGVEGLFDYERWRGVEKDYPVIGFDYVAEPDVAVERVYQNTLEVFHKSAAQNFATFSHSLLLASAHLYAVLLLVAEEKATYAGKSYRSLMDPRKNWHNSALHLATLHQYLTESEAPARSSFVPQHRENLFLKLWMFEYGLPDPADDPDEFASCFGRDTILLVPTNDIFAAEMQQIDSQQRKEFLLRHVMAREKNTKFTNLKSLMYWGVLPPEDFGALDWVKKTPLRYSFQFPWDEYPRMVQITKYPEGFPYQ